MYVTRCTHLYIYIHVHVDYILITTVYHDEVYPTCCIEIYTVYVCFLQICKIFTHYNVCTVSTSFHVKFQERFQPKADYIHKQPDITNSMRCILIDWLVEVCDEFKLDQHTLYLGISIVDR